MTKRRTSVTATPKKPRPVGSKGGVDVFVPGAMTAAAHLKQDAPSAVAPEVFTPRDVAVFASGCDVEMPPLFVMDTLDLDPMVIESSGPLPAAPFRCAYGCLGTLDPYGLNGERTHSPGCYYWTDNPKACPF